MKKYYSLMVTVLAFIIGSTGCIIHPATDYGIPWSNDEDAPFYDDFEETEADEIQADSDVNDVDVSDIDADKIDSDIDDNDLIEPDEDSRIDL
ncbi:MAG TPA: hypothetical protein PLZ43_05725 [bacterium]|nr:hypothetical protein [bacterium]